MKRKTPPESSGAETVSEEEPEPFEINGIEFEYVDVDDEEILRIFGESEPPSSEPVPRRTTRKQLFEEAYEDTKYKTRIQD